MLNLTRFLQMFLRWTTAAMWSFVVRSLSTTKTCRIRRRWARRPKNSCRAGASLESDSWCSATWAKRKLPCVSSASGSNQAKSRCRGNTDRVWLTVGACTCKSLPSQSNCSSAVASAGPGNCGERHRKHWRCVAASLEAFLLNHMIGIWLFFLLFFHLGAFCSMMAGGNIGKQIVKI